MPSGCCFDCKSTKNLRAIHNGSLMKTMKHALFRLQKYKKFESNSQQLYVLSKHVGSCFDCKSTKNLRAIHNAELVNYKQFNVVSTAKVQKIWEQFTTNCHRATKFMKLFRLQKYKKFESNSQQDKTTMLMNMSCFDCKSTKNLRAIHNIATAQGGKDVVVSTAKVQKIWEQFTTRLAEPVYWSRCFDCKSTKNLRAIHNGYDKGRCSNTLFRLQKYKKFESNSQPSSSLLCEKAVVSTAKVQKIWEQFTTVKQSHVRLR